MSIDHEFTQEIVCPWCGYEYGDSWDCGEGGKRQCDECGKHFSFSKDYDVTYSTCRKKCKVCDCELSQEKLHNPYIYKDKNWTIYKCKVCEDIIVKTGEVAKDNEPYISPLVDEEVEDGNGKNT